MNYFNRTIDSILNYVNYTLMADITKPELKKKELKEQVTQYLIDRYDGDEEFCFWVVNNKLGIEISKSFSFRWWRLIKKFKGK